MYNEWTPSVNSVVWKIKYSFGNLGSGFPVASELNIRHISRTQVTANFSHRKHFETLASEIVNFCS